MAADFNVLLYDPIYASELAVPAVFQNATMAPTPGGFQASGFQSDTFQVPSIYTVDVTVIDDTRAKTNTSGSLEMKSVAPGAFARIPELIEYGIEHSNYDGSTLTFNGRTWIIRNHELIGSPNGEDAGEVRFSLMKPSDG